MEVCLCVCVQSSKSNVHLVKTDFVFPEFHFLRTTFLSTILFILSLFPQPHQPYILSSRKTAELSSQIIQIYITLITQIEISYLQACAFVFGSFENIMLRVSVRLFTFSSSSRIILTAVDFHKLLLDSKGVGL